MKKIAILVLFLGLGATALFADNIKEAETYLKQGRDKFFHDYTGAIQDFSKAIELNPKSVTAYNERGDAKYSLHDYTGAIQDFSKVIEFYPKCADVYYSRGLSKEMLKDKWGALEDFSKAVERRSLWRDTKNTKRGLIGDSGNTILNY